MSKFQDTTVKQIETRGSLECSAEFVNSVKNQFPLGGRESENLPCVHAMGLMKTEIGKRRKLVAPAYT